MMLPERRAELTPQAPSPQVAAFPQTATRVFSHRRSLISFVTTNFLLQLIWSMADIALKDGRLL